MTSAAEEPHTDLITASVDAALAESRCVVPAADFRFGRARLWLLLWGHFTATGFAIWGLSSGYPSQRQWDFWPALFTAQACLLGMSLSLAQGSVHQRVALMVVGIGSLSALLACGLSSSRSLPERFAMNFLAALAVVGAPALGTAIILFGLRWRKKVWLIRLRAAEPIPTDLRFSTRHLLWLVAIIAILLAAKPLVQLRTVPGVLTTLTIFNLCWSATALAMAWATLGLPRPYVRLLLASTVAVSTRLLVAYYADKPWDFREFPAISIGMPTIVAASLLVLRSEGYRLVWGPGAEVRHTEPSAS